MKNAPLILACAAGLAAGAFVGSRDHRALPAASSASDADVHGNSTGADARMDRALAFSSDDARITRLFSALREPIALKKRAELFEALQDLTAQDLPGLVKHAEGLSFTLRGEVLPVLVERWFAVDFDAAQTWMRAHPREYSAVKAWAQANPEAAIQEALANPKGSRSAQLLSEAIWKLSGENFAAQVARIKTIPASKLRDDVFRNVLPEWAKTDPASAFAALAEISPGQVHDLAREQMMDELAERDPAGALAQLNAILPTLTAGVLGNRLVTETAERIGKKDPQLALDWLSGLAPEFRIAPAIGAARMWAAKEPAAALDWCMANGVDVARGKRDGIGSWQAGVLGEAMAAQPEATVAWLQSLPAGPDRDRLLERGLADSFWKAPKDQLFGENGVAFRLFRDLPEDGQIRSATRLGRTRAEQGGLTDLQAWAQNFSPGRARADAVAGAIGAAYARDASSIEPLLATTTAAPDRDAALRGLAEAMTYAAPADAATRALTIGDTTLRRDALESVVTSWQKRDPGATRAWLENATAIPAAWKQAWLPAK